MALQTTLDDDPGKLVLGMIPEGGPWVIRNFRLEGSTAVGYGECVTAGTSWGQCNSCADENLTTSNFKGVVVRDRTKSASDDDKFSTGQMVPVLQYGPVAVMAGEAIAANAALIAVDLDGGVDFHDQDTAATVPIFATGRDAAADNAVFVIDVHGLRRPDYT